MCQQIIQFCTGSNKPLLFVGSFISILLAIAIGYTGCTTNALYNDIDPQVAQSISLGYYVQLAASVYLVVITLFSCYAAYYDHKHSIRALAFITALNFVLALVAMLMVPSGVDLAKLFTETLKQAETKYDFTEKYAPATVLNQPGASSSLLEREAVSSGGSAGKILNSTQDRPVRWAIDGETVPGKQNNSGPAAAPVRELNKHEATEIWDKLQAHGCCGLRNGTEEWKGKLPKSCCSSQPIKVGEEWYCKEIDADHQQGCLALIGSTSLNLFIVLALIALVNLYMATVTGLSAYKTLHYDEAAQGAYT